MDTRRNTRADRVERILRGVMGLALLAAVAWAWVNSAPVGSLGFLAGNFLP